MSNVVYLNIPTRRHFVDDGFKGVWCSCGKHLAEHANRDHGTPYAKYIDPRQWFCPQQSAQRR